MEWRLLLVMDQMRDIGQLDSFRKIEARLDCLDIIDPCFLTILSRGAKSQGLDWVWLNYPGQITLGGVPGPTWFQSIRLSITGEKFERFIVFTHIN
jgi:hypothetical protein